MNDFLFWSLALLGLILLLFIFKRALEKTFESMGTPKYYILLIWMVFILVSYVWFVIDSWN
jgi:uncharacterized membrane protein